MLDIVYQAVSGNDFGEDAFLRVASIAQTVYDAYLVSTGTRLRTVFQGGPDTRRLTWDIHGRLFAGDTCSQAVSYSRGSQGKPADTRPLRESLQKPGPRQRFLVEQYRIRVTVTLDKPRCFPRYFLP
jgi:hypothetical protein